MIDAWLRQIIITLEKSTSPRSKMFVGDIPLPLQ